MHLDDDGHPRFRVIVVHGLSHHSLQYVLAKPLVGLIASGISFGEPPSGKASIMATNFELLRDVSNFKIKAIFN